MASTTHDWIQFIKSYRDLMQCGKDFVRGLGYPTTSIEYPLSGSNHSGLLPNENAAILVQARQAGYGV